NQDRPLPEHREWPTLLLLPLCYILIVEPELHHHQRTAEADGATHEAAQQRGDAGPERGLRNAETTLGWPTRAARGDRSSSCAAISVIAGAIQLMMRMPSPSPCLLKNVVATEISGRFGCRRPVLRRGSAPGSWRRSRRARASLHGPR